MTLFIATYIVVLVLLTSEKFPQNIYLFNTFNIHGDSKLFMRKVVHISHYLNNLFACLIECLCLKLLPKACLTQKQLSIHILYIFKLFKKKSHSKFN